MTATMFDLYDERLRRRRVQPNTLRNYARTAALFEESGLDPLTAEDWQIEEWFAGLELSPRTKRLHAENLSAMYGYAVYRRLLTTNPMEGVRLPREPDKEPRILSNGELRQLLGACVTPQETLLLHLLIYTGMRRDEVRKLLWEDVDVPTTITVREGKGGKLRHVPMHPALAEVLEASPHDSGAVIRALIADQGEIIANTTLVSRLNDVRERAGVPCSFHDFRRTVATSLAENDVSERVIDTIMGWAPRTVGRRYYIRTADTKAQEAILRLYADDPLTPLT